MMRAASSTTNHRRYKRLSSLYCILLLCLTPLSGLYILFLSIQSSFTDYNPSSSSSSNIQDTNTNNNIHNTVDGGVNALQQIMNHHRNHPQQQLFAYSYYYLSSSTTEEHQQRILPVLCKIVLPWGISVILGILMPCIGYLYSILGSRNQRYGGIGGRFREQQRNQLQLTLQQFRKVLSRKDCVLVDDDNHDYDDDDKNNHQRNNDDGLKNIPNNDNNNNEATTTTETSRKTEQWIIPLAGQPLCPLQEQQQQNSCSMNPSPGQNTTIIKTNNNSQQQQRTVTGPCVICWTSYKYGDSIVWSTNPNCIHCFHESCLISWCLSNQQQQQLRQIRRQQRHLARNNSSSNSTAQRQQQQQQQQQQQPYYPCPCCRQNFCSAVDESANSGRSNVSNRITISSSTTNSSSSSRRSI